MGNLMTGDVYLWHLDHRLLSLIGGCLIHSRLCSQTLLLSFFLVHGCCSSLGLVYSKLEVCTYVDVVGKNKNEAILRL